jgi:hypothetical protein
MQENEVLLSANIVKSEFERESIVQQFVERFPDAPVARSAEATEPKGIVYRSSASGNTMTFPLNHSFSRSQRKLPRSFR